MVQRIVYALIFIIILAFLGGLVAHVATAEVNSGKQSSTVTVLARPATAPPPPPPPQPTPEPSGATVPLLITNRGVFTQPAILYSDDRVTKLSFNEGTVGHTKEGDPLRETYSTKIGDIYTVELGEIYIVEMEAPPPSPEGSYIIGLVYDFGPDGVTFNPPISLTFTYDESLIPEGIAEENLVIAMCDAASGQWVPLGVFIIAPEINIITALVSHFTPFTILAYPRPPAFAAFAASDLLIIPTEIDIGETVNIIILVANTGGQSGGYELTLKINGVVEASKKVTIAAGGSELVSFSTIKNTAGTYSLEVAGFTGSFTVKEKPVAPPPPPPPPTVTIPIPPPPSNLPIIGGIIAAVALAMAGLIYSFLIHRRYKYAAITYPVEVERPVAPPLPKPISYPAVISIREATGMIMAAVATAVAVAIVGGARFLLSIREVIGRGTVILAVAIVGWVRFLVSKRKTK